MKILTKIFSFVFELIFFIGITIFGISFLVSRFFNQNYYTQILDDIDIKEMKISELGIKELDEKYKDMTIEEAIITELESASIDSKIAIEVIESREVKEVLGKIISEVVDYELAGAPIPQLDYDSLDKLLNNEQVSKILKEEQIEIDKEELLNEINKTLREELGDVNEWFSSNYT